MTISCFFCYFVIRRLQNFDGYTVQCITSFKEHDGSMDKESTKYSDLDDARRTLILYGTLFQIISAFIILHVTVNACGFLTWIWKIYLDNIFFNSSGKSGNARVSEDIRFFLYVVHEQLGHVVSKELSESLIPDTPDTTLPFLDPEEKGEMSDDNV